MSLANGLTPATSSFVAMPRSRACLLLLLALVSGIEGMHYCFLPLISACHAFVCREIGPETHTPDVRRNTTVHTSRINSSYSTVSIVVLNTRLAAYNSPGVYLSYCLCRTLRWPATPSRSFRKGNPSHHYAVCVHGISVFVTTFRELDKPMACSTWSVYSPHEVSAINACHIYDTTTTIELVDYRTVENLCS